MRTVVDEWYGGYTAGHLILTTVLEHLYNTTTFGDGGEGKLVFTGRSAIDIYVIRFDE